MASSDILSKTLDSITATKLNEISKQRVLYEAAKARILKDLKNVDVPNERVLILLDGIKELRLLDKLGTQRTLDINNIRSFLKQTRHDPSISLALQKQWESMLLHELDVQSLRFEYASLYAGLVTEWSSTSSEALKSLDMEGFEKVGRKEMHVQRATWEQYVFKPLETDSEQVNTFLEKLFWDNKSVKEATLNLKVKVRQFERLLNSETSFDETSLDWCIDGLLSSDLLSDAKRSVLIDFSNNKVVLRELADVLNMRMNALDSWQWDSEGTFVEQRRQLNGKYRFFHDEDLLQAIFIRYIGVKWSVFFKQALKQFIAEEGVWRTPSNPMTKLDQQRRLHFLGPGGRGRFSEKDFINKNSVEAKRRDLWENDVFLEQLQTNYKEHNRSYDGSDSDSDAEDARVSNTRTPLHVTQSVLHLLSSDIIIKTRLGEDVTVLRSDFEWFGPSQPHSTFFVVLRFLGVSDRWIDFFRRFLECPIRIATDGVDAPVRIRKRGTTPSNPLSDMLSETLLFCLDFGVNQHTGGKLFRLHDDIWFWGKEKACESAWSTITEFTDVMGLKLNAAKTGCVKITRKSGDQTDMLSTLPRGVVGWGCLKLDGKTGRFIIDQNMVSNHIKELRLQLGLCKSVFDWIQAWNTYAVRFFTNNFGQPAGCSGQAYVDMILETFERIQDELFRDTGASSVTDTIKDMISKRFNIENIPEGFLYFPLTQCGLDLRSPFIGPYLIRDSLPENPDIYMDEFFKAEAASYRRYKVDYETSDRRLTSVEGVSFHEPFMSFDEYSRYREQTSRELLTAYEQLMAEPGQNSVNATPDVLDAVKHAKIQWNRLSAYDKWLYQLYGSDMISRFSGLSVMERGLLPTGMVNMLRRSRFQWAQ